MCIIRVKKKIVILGAGRRRGELRVELLDYVFDH